MINVMVNGLPGNMAATVVAHARNNPELELFLGSLTGEDISEEYWEDILLIKPSDRGNHDWTNMKSLIAIDFTLPSAVNGNAEFYFHHKIPFVMGTTGGDRDALMELAEKSDTPCVIAPNMAPQIVAFQAAMQILADKFIKVFEGYDFSILESHQAGKVDTSGTADAVRKSFNKMGAEYLSKKSIQKERNPIVQRSVWGVPDNAIEGHGYHQYHLMSPDGTVDFHFEHNVRGRDIYALGTILAIKFLHKKIAEGSTGVFSMIDVLQG